MLTVATWPYKSIAAPLLKRGLFNSRSGKKPQVESTGATMVTPARLPMGAEFFVDRLPDNNVLKILLYNMASLMDIAS